MIAPQQTQPSALMALVDRLDTSSVFNRLRGKMAAAAQAVYDDWDQDEHGMDSVLGMGGICELVAGSVLSVINDARVRVVTDTAESEEHVHVLCLCKDGVFTIDITPQLYEIHHGLFHWEKKPGVKFDEAAIDIECLDRHPLGAALYFDPDRITSAIREFAAVRRRLAIVPSMAGPGD